MTRPTTALLAWNTISLPLTTGGPEKRFTIAFQNPDNLIERNAYIFLAEMLKYPIRENHVEGVLGKRQKTRIANDEIGFDPQLFRYSPGRQNRFQTWIQTDRQVARLRCSDRPSAPVTTDIEQSLTISLPEAHPGYRIPRQFVFQRKIKKAGCIWNFSLNEPVHLVFFLGTII